MVFPPLFVVRLLLTCALGKTTPLRANATQDEKRQRGARASCRGPEFSIRIFFTVTAARIQNRRFIIKLGMNQVLDGQTRALKFIHYRDETNEAGFLLPYVRVFLDRIFRFIIKLWMNQVLDGQTTAQRQGETFRVGNSILSYGPV